MVNYLGGVYQVSQRRACEVARIPVSTFRYQSTQEPRTALRLRIREIAQARTFAGSAGGTEGEWLYFDVCIRMKRIEKNSVAQFPGSSMVEHSAVNRRVASSNLARGANLNLALN